MKWANIRNLLFGVLCVVLGFVLIGVADGNKVTLVAAMVVLAVGLFFAIAGGL